MDKEIINGMPSAPRFGPGGSSESFKNEKHRSLLEMADWLTARGLDAFEYEGGQGIRGTEEGFRALGAVMKKNSIAVSVHAPYFISLSGTDPEKRLKSLEYIAASVVAAELMEANTVVVHCGSCATISREEGMALSRDTLEKTLDFIKTDVHIGIETMGKINQLGTLEEVVELCSISPRLYPVVDFGHLNARNLGGCFMGEDDYRRVFDLIGEKLGDDKARYLHCHFSKIMYTEKGGEKRHLTFADTEYGPEFGPLAEVIAKDGLCPTIICESDGTQAEDAMEMKKMYLSALNK